MSPLDKPLVWLHGEIQNTTVLRPARREAGFLLWRLRGGEMLTMPHARPMPTIGTQCHELRIRDADNYWRIIYRLDEDAVIIAEVFSKKTNTTPHQVIETCRARLQEYDDTIAQD